MKKIKIFTGVFILTASILSAQTADKPVTIRIKKVENINGAEKITDTTYTTTDPALINSGHQSVKIIGKGEGNFEEIEKTLKESGVDINAKGAKKIVIINEDKNDDGKSGEKNITEIVIIKTDITDANPEECKKAGIKSAPGKLVIEDMNCTPNPSNGKFNLKFSSPDKSSTGIIVKDINGKIVYTENVKQFDGSYDKEISLDNVKGIYFVTVIQGTKATTKKLVVE
jgi:hypothetical protein